jgi:glutamyl/glutaminyl-tRNA synthetase
MSAENMAEKVLSWSNINDKDFFEILNKYNNKEEKENQSYLEKVLNIEREVENPRKDISNMSSVKSNIFYMFDELFEKEEMDFVCDKNILEKIKIILNDDINYKEDTKLEDWMSFMKQEYAKLKEDLVSKNNENQNIKFGELMMIMRKLITKREKTPNLYFIFQVLGKKKVLNRIENLNN